MQDPISFALVAFSTCLSAYVHWRDNPVTSLGWAACLLAASFGFNAYLLGVVVLFTAFLAMIWALIASSHYFILFLILQSVLVTTSDYGWWILWSGTALCSIYYVGLWAIPYAVGHLLVFLCIKYSLYSPDDRPWLHHSPPPLFLFLKVKLARFAPFLDCYLMDIHPALSMMSKYLLRVLTAVTDFIVETVKTGVWKFTQSYRWCPRWKIEEYARISAEHKKERQDQKTPYATLCRLRDENNRRWQQTLKNRQTEPQGRNADRLPGFAPPPPIHNPFGFDEPSPVVSEPKCKPFSKIFLETINSTVQSHISDNTPKDVELTGSGIQAPVVVAHPPPKPKSHPHTPPTPATPTTPATLDTSIQMQWGPDFGKQAAVKTPQNSGMVTCTHDESDPVAPTAPKLVLTPPVPKPVPTPPAPQVIEIKDVEMKDANDPMEQLNGLLDNLTIGSEHDDMEIDHSASPLAWITGKPAFSPLYVRVQPTPVPVIAPRFLPAVPVPIAGFSRSVTVAPRPPTVPAFPVPRLPVLPIAPMVPATPMPRPIAPIAPVTPMLRPVAPIVPAISVPRPIVPMVPAAPMPLPIAPMAPAAPMPLPIAPMVPAASVSLPIAPMAPAAPMPLPIAPMVPAASVPLPITPVAPAAPMIPSPAVINGPVYTVTRAPTPVVAPPTVPMIMGSKRAPSPFKPASGPAVITVPDITPNFSGPALPLPSAVPAPTASVFEFSAPQAFPTPPTLPTAPTAPSFAVDLSAPAPLKAAPGRRIAKPRISRRALAKLSVPRSAPAVPEKAPSLEYDEAKLLEEFLELPDVSPPKFDEATIKELDEALFGPDPNAENIPAYDDLPSPGPIDFTEQEISNVIRRSIPDEIFTQGAFDVDAAPPVLDLRRPVTSVQPADTSAEDQVDYSSDGPTGDLPVIEDHPSIPSSFIPGGDFTTENLPAQPAPLLTAEEEEEMSFNLLCGDEDPMAQLSQGRQRSQEEIEMGIGHIPGPPPVYADDPADVAKAMTAAADPNPRVIKRRTRRGRRVI
ncbi:hypothetical protein EKO27_g4929 [Xylaria grammica]|uniref:Uncharacterized protein n=1 Tax=Xylaria grammica TaxID=363999 RepID=A0A439D712_9PEZI|nr:hypothetical protein EKO27_g4929 [Xylaria grammica]